MTVHTPPRLDAARRTVAGRWTLLLLLAACAAPVIASYFMYYVVRPEGRSNYATLIDPAPPMPADLPLADLDGRSVGAASLRGQWLIVVVGDAACTAACEQRLFAQRQLREMTGRERERIDKVFLVTDAAPLRAELRAALAVAPATQVLRVPRAALDAWLRPAAGQALDAHLYLVDPMGRWMMRAPPALEPSKFKRDIERLLRASSSWDTPGR
ncbi:MAG TPA: hypothetical protein VFQ20_05600 [Burkholderiaceae bacterium]|nr:hypothetical protein [Burkholderiaceae bacterium]